MIIASSKRPKALCNSKGAALISPGVVVGLEPLSVSVLELLIMLVSVPSEGGLDGSLALSPLPVIDVEPAEPKPVVVVPEPVRELKLSMVPVLRLLPSLLNNEVGLLWPPDWTCVRGAPLLSCRVGSLVYKMLSAVGSLP